MIRLHWCLIFAALLVLTGCTRATLPTPAIAAHPTAALPAQVIDAPNPTVVAAPTQPAPQVASSASTAATCPVTLPNGSTPPGQEPSALHHGNGALWTLLERDGIFRATPDNVGSDGSIGMKSWWWRGPSVRGRLTITGRRLDVPAPPLEAHIPAGYGDTGFQVSGIDFPTEGCWEVTGRAGNATLTFVTFVVKEKQ